MSDTKRLEARLRRKAQRLGFRVEKNRACHADNPFLGGFMVINAYTGFVAEGARHNAYDADLDDVCVFR